MPFSLYVVIILAMIAGGIKVYGRSLKKQIDQMRSNDGGPGPETVTTRDEYRGTSSTTVTPYGSLMEQYKPVKWATRGTLGLMALLLIIGSITSVGTKEIGVITTFGKPSGQLSNGVHLKWPWQKVTQLDAAIQTDSRVNDQKSGICTSTSVRLANQSTACVDNSIRWRIKEDAADALFRDYRGFENIRDSLVTRQLNASLNSVMSSYNPLAALLQNGKITAPDVVSLGKAVEKDIQGKIGSQIEVLSVIIPYLGFDAGTQAKINLYQAAIADTRIASQQEQTTANQAQANKNLASSVSHDPNVLVSRCFDTFAEMVKERLAVPAGFSCWPGGGSAVVVPAK